MKCCNSIFGFRKTLIEHFVEILDTSKASNTHFKYSIFFPDDQCDEEVRDIAVTLLVSMSFGYKKYDP